MYSGDETSLRLLLDKPPYYRQLKCLCFYLWYLCYLPIDLRHQHIPAANVFHLITVPLRVPGPS
jgi:hypothetical protein